MKPLVNITLILLSVLLNLIISGKGEDISKSCLQCICKASSGCKLETKCHNSGSNAYFCGPYQISWAYWADAGKPGNTGRSDDFEHCLNDKNCAEVAVRGYMTKWKKDCNNDGVIDCLDFGAIHKAGASSCDQQWLYNSEYWNVFRQCQISTSDSSLQPTLIEQPWTPSEAPADPKPQSRPLSPPLSDPWNDPRPQTQPLSRPTLKPQIFPNIPNNERQPPSASNNGWTQPYPSNQANPNANDPWGQPQDQPRPPLAQPQPLPDQPWNPSQPQPYLPNPQPIPSPQSPPQPVPDEPWIQPQPQPYPNNPQPRPTRKPQSQPQRQPLPNQPWTQPSSQPNNPRPQPPVDESYVQPYPAANPWDQPSDQPSQPSDTQPFVDFIQPQPVTDDPWDEISRAVDDLAKPTPKPQPQPQPQPQPNLSDPWNQPQPQSPPLSIPGRAPTQPVSWSTNPSNTFGQPFIPNQPQNNPQPSPPLIEPNYSSDNGSVDDNCLECICQASSDCDLNKQCEGSYCGPYLLSWAYWSDSGQPGGDYVTCANNKGCAEQSVRGYMNKWQSDCNGDGIIDCTDFATIHRLGPHSCQTESIRSTDYWKSFESCKAPAIDARRLPTNSESHTGRSVPQTVPSANLFQEYPTQPNQPNNNPVPRNAPNYFSRDDRIVFPSEQPNHSQNSPLIPSNFGVSPGPTPPISANNGSNNRVFEEFGLKRDCLDCICHASSKCNSGIGCQNDGTGGYVCGPYQMNWAYWSESGKPGVRGNLENLENYQSCLNNKECAEASIYGYMKKWKRDCNEDQQIDCYDFAALHMSGPSNCNSQWFLESQYWSDFRECFDFRRRK